MFLLITVKLAINCTTERSGSQRTVETNLTRLTEEFYVKFTISRNLRYTSGADVKTIEI